MPRAARSLILAVVTAGAATTVCWLPGVATWAADDWLALAAIVLTTSVAERFPLELLYRNERAVYSLADAVWTAALLLVRPSVLTLAVAAGVLLGQLFARRPPLKIAFNVGQFVLGITAAVGVFGLLGAPAAHEPVAWLAAGFAMAAFQLVNTVLVGAILSLVEERPFREVALATTGVLHWLGNVAAGILGALVWTAQPGGLPVLLVPVVLTYLAYRGWLRTVQERDWMDEMGRAAELIARSGDLSKRITATGRPDAVGRLGATLNDMLERLEASFRRERTFIRESSHELRTPITICRGYLDVLSPVPDPDELSETIDVVKDELDRMSRLVDDMCGLAYMEDPSSLRRGEVPLEQFVGEVASKARPLLNGRLQVDQPSEPTLLRGDVQRLTQALINLIQNARDHTPGDTPIRLRVVGEARTLRFEVADQGGGLSPDAEGVVFQPFYKGNRSKGSGLGLAIVVGIARAHGGAAGLDNRFGDGATFWVRVPR